MSEDGMGNVIWGAEPKGGRGKRKKEAKPGAPAEFNIPLLFEDLTDNCVEVEGNHIYFYAEVTEDSILQLVRTLQKLKVELLLEKVRLEIPSPRPIHLHISSFGGSLFAGFAGVDAIRECTREVPVHTHIEGNAASAATLLSIVGTQRTIGANSFILIHQLSSVLWGKYEELKDQMKNDDLLMERIYQMYCERTKIPLEELKEILKKDLWLDAATALEKGLVDEIR